MLGCGKRSAEIFGGGNWILWEASSRDEDGEGHAMAMWESRSIDVGEELACHGGKAVRFLICVPSYNGVNIIF